MPVPFFPLCRKIYKTVGLCKGQRTGPYTGLEASGQSRRHCVTRVRTGFPVLGQQVACFRVSPCSWTDTVRQQLGGQRHLLTFAPVPYAS